jgi:hypothetical protein
LIRTTTTSLQRARVLAAAALLVTSACLACTGTTAVPCAKPVTAARATGDEVRPSAQPSKHESLATPEAAVSLYVECIAASDFACALRAYAARERAARFDYTALVRFVQHWSPGSLNAPAQYPMFVELNELRAKANLAQATKLFVYGLLADMDLTRVQTVESDAEVQSFVQAVNPARLAKLTVVRIDQPRKLVLNGPEAQAIFKARAAREGADEVTERIALYELSGQLYWGGFQLSRYDKGWKIYEFGSNFAGPLASAVVGKTTATEYEGLLQ